MTTPTGREIHELTRAECLGLLDRSHLGRLAFLDDVGLYPIVVPVNYVVHAGSVVFRTGSGRSLAAAVRGANVAFEVDHSDDVEQTGWSVLVRGIAEEVTDPAELGALLDRGLQPQAPGDRRHHVRVHINLLSGRRIDLATAAGPWWDPTA